MAPTVEPYQSNPVDRAMSKRRALRPPKAPNGPQIITQNGQQGFMGKGGNFQQIGAAAQRRLAAGEQPGQFGRPVTPPPVAPPPQPLPNAMNKPLALSSADPGATLPGMAGGERLPPGPGALPSDSVLVGPGGPVGAMPMDRMPPGGPMPNFGGLPPELMARIQALRAAGIGGAGMPPGGPGGIQGAKPLMAPGVGGPPGIVGPAGIPGIMAQQPGAMPQRGGLDQYWRQTPNLQY